MGSVHAEFLKLKRSLTWAVVVLLPVIAVLAGAMTTFVPGGVLSDGWHTLWIRSIGFHGMALLPVGVALLASLVWRVEHGNGNWNALMGQPVPTAQVVIAKAAAVSVLAAAMQAFLVATVIALGTLAFGLPGTLPAEYWASSLVVIVACVPVAALQSGLSALLRSFAAPVAIAFVLTGLSTTLLMNGADAASVLPYALATRATQLGTVLVSGEATSFDAAALSVESVLFLVLASAAMTVVIVAATTAVIDRRDTRV
ncbi:ABC transporter permease [Nocardiopsis aegyptia]|uniref:ABC transporter permease n=1 Tax=Nocardiopsis aegyptia TaxID=220378 RepID=UPI00366AD563